MAPWTSGWRGSFGAVLLGAPFTAPAGKGALAVLLTAAAIMLAGFSMACGGQGITQGTTCKPARTCHRDSHGDWHGDKPGYQ